jgi:hypothetical protein
MCVLFVAFQRQNESLICYDRPYLIVIVVKDEVKVQLSCRSWGTDGNVEAASAIVTNRVCAFAHITREHGSVIAERAYGRNVPVSVENNPAHGRKWTRYKWRLAAVGSDGAHNGVTVRALQTLQSAAILTFCSWRDGHY